MLWSPLSSLKLARMAALSFCTTDLSSAIVLEARTLRMNCLTDLGISGSVWSLESGLTGTHCWLSLSSLDEVEVQARRICSIGET